MRILILLLGFLLARGELQAGASIKKYVDYREIGLTAVLLVPDARDLHQSGLMVTDRVVEELGEAGLAILERGTQQGYLLKQGIEVDVHMPRQKILAIGKGLGVQAVVVGRIDAQLEESETGTMASRRKMLVRRNGRMVQVWREPESAAGKVQYFQTDGMVNLLLTMKMIRVDNGEAMWMISSEARKLGFQKALEAVLEPGMTEITRSIRRSLAGHNVKVKVREKPKGLDKGWDRTHKKKRF